MVEAGPSVVVFDREGNLASLQRSVLRAMGCSNNGLVTTKQALLKELVIGRDLVLLNWSEDWDDLIDLIRTIRNKTTSPDPFVGLVVLSSEFSNSRSRAAVDAGANSLVTVPFAAGHIMAHVKHVTTKQWRFIDAPNYFGPDRRIHNEMIEHDERREGQCRILEGAELVAERLRMRSTALAAFEIKVAHTA
ncbi:MAG: hypothetical protein NT015_12715 [Alphaproteobacteria bacterium]|nr:hypothetical protein [Alphaproteobacteria bacterium]